MRPGERRDPHARPDRGGQRRHGGDREADRGDGRLVEGDPADRGERQEHQPDRLDPLRGSLVETGRSCVHPEHRNGAVVSLVWAGIARYLLLTGNRWLVGCASMPLRGAGLPDGALAAGVWDLAAERHLAPAEYRMRRLHPFEHAGVPRPARTVLPPAAARLPAPRRLGLRAARPGGRFRGGRLPRPARRGPHRPALSAALPGQAVTPHPWRPISACGDGCLPTAGSLPAAARWLRVLRLAGAAVTGGVPRFARPVSGELSQDSTCHSRAA